MSIIDLIKVLKDDLLKEQIKSMRYLSKTKGSQELFVLKTAEIYNFYIFNFFFLCKKSIVMKFKLFICWVIKEEKMLHQNQEKILALLIANTKSYLATHKYFLTLLYSSETSFTIGQKGNPRWQSCLHVVA